MLTIPSLIVSPWRPFYVRAICELNETIQYRNHTINRLSGDNEQLQTINSRFMFPTMAAYSAALTYDKHPVIYEERRETACMAAWRLSGK